mmetsp:Transcript_77458/g.206853  ORF Transcript_77458/g.206853 Transcript_77458/m.206853 type:complete len:224 (-) Transcript_77458:23-694(-)
MTLHTTKFSIVLPAQGVHHTARLHLLTVHVDHTQNELAQGGDIAEKVVEFGPADLVACQCHARSIGQEETEHEGDQADDGGVGMNDLGNPVREVVREALHNDGPSQPPQGKGEKPLVPQPEHASKNKSHEQASVPNKPSASFHGLGRHVREHVGAMVGDRRARRFRDRRLGLPHGLGHHPLLIFFDLLLFFFRFLGVGLAYLRRGRHAVVDGPGNTGNHGEHC